jgi:hypothetical protein
MKIIKLKHVTVSVKRLLKRASAALLVSSSCTKAPMSLIICSVIGFPCYAYTATDSTAMKIGAMYCIKMMVATLPQQDININS